MIAKAAAAITRLFDKAEAPSLEIVATNEASPASPLAAIEDARRENRAIIEKARTETATLIAACEGTVAASEDALRVATAELEAKDIDLAAAERAHEEAASAFEREDTDLNAYAVGVSRERVPRSRALRDQARQKKAEAEQFVTTARAALMRATEAAQLVELTAESSADRFHEKIAPLAMKLHLALQVAQSMAMQIDAEFLLANMVAARARVVPLGPEHLVLDLLRVLVDAGVVIPNSAWSVVRKCLQAPAVISADQLTSVFSAPSASSPREATLSNGLAAGGLIELLNVLHEFRTDDPARCERAKLELEMMFASRESGAVERLNSTHRNRVQRERAADEERARLARMDAQARENYAREQRVQSKHLAPNPGRWSMTRSEDE